jgi:phosphoribosyl-AMP cyclohydrolase
MSFIESVSFNEKGLVPVIAQDAADGRVLMLAWADREALLETAQSGFATYFSRSRNRLWRKGEESGNRQKIIRIQLDCDGDSVLYLVESTGGVACHTGRRSCFYRTLNGSDWQITEPVLQDPEVLYGKKKKE